MKISAMVLPGAICMLALVTLCSCRPNEEAHAGNATTSLQSATTTQENRTKNEAEIRELIDRYVKAVRAKDIHGVMSVYAPELVGFDIVPPLQYVGADSYVKPWQDVFERYQDPLDYEVRGLSITAGDDVAFSHSFNRISGTLKSGQKAGFWLRYTACYRKINGKWLIVHLQASVPVDLANGKPVLDLKP